MPKKYVRPLAAMLVMALGALEPAVAQTGAPVPARSGYADLGGIKLYYEVYGSGEPLVLLHGGLGSIEMFAPILPALAAGRQVVAVDLQAHGRTADIDRPLSFESMSDDVAGLIEKLGYARADVMGYSLGGGVALQTAIRHPEVVRKLVLVSTPFKREGWYPEVLAGMSGMVAAAAEPMKQTPMYQLYAAIAPRPADWSALITKTGDLLRRDYDWSRGAAGLKMPVLIVGGDADAVKLSHLADFFALLGGGARDAGWDGSGRSATAQLAILPGATHYDIFMSPALAATVDRFLEVKAAPVR